MSETIDFWAVVELLGHRVLAGHVTEAALAGVKFLRVAAIRPGLPPLVQFYLPSAVYGLTPVTETEARRAAENATTTPAEYLTRALPSAASGAPEADDAREPWEGDDFGDDGDAPAPADEQVPAPPPEAPAAAAPATEPPAEIPVEPPF